MRMRDGIGTVMALLLLSAGVTSAQEGAVAKVVKVEGPVFVRPSSSGRFVKARPEQRLTGDTYVRTDKGGRAEILLRDGTLLSLREDSQVLVNDMLVKAVRGRGVLGAASGVVEVTVRKLGREESFQVVAPSAVLGVRGTRFLVETLPDGSVVVQVLEGEVAVAAVGGGEAAVSAGGTAGVSLEDSAVRSGVDPVAYRGERTEALRRDPGVAAGRLVDRMAVNLSNASRVSVDTNNYAEEAHSHLVRRSAMAGLRETVGRLRRTYPRNDVVAAYAERAARIDARFEEISRLIEERLRRIDELYEARSRAIDERYEAVESELERRYQQRLGETNRRPRLRR